MLVLWNDASRQSEKMSDLKNEIANWKDCDLVTPNSRQDTIDILEKRASEFDRVIAAGGDGTVNGVAEGLFLSKSNAALGVLPIGSGNDLARSLNMAINPWDAWEMVRTCGIGPLDLLHCRNDHGERFAVNMVTLGNSGRMSELISEEIKNRWGPLCYLRGAANLIGDIVTYDMTSVIDNEENDSKSCMNLFMANGKTSGGGLSVAPNSAFDDGLLDLVTIEEGDASELFDLTANYVLDDYLNHPLVNIQQAQKVRIESNPPMPVTVDGDEFGETPLEVIVMHNAISVLCRE